MSTDGELNARGVVAFICQATASGDWPAAFARLDSIPPTVWVRSMLLLMKVINGNALSYDTGEIRQEIASALAAQDRPVTEPPR